MKIKPEQVYFHLKNTTEYIYWIAGDEPLQQQEILHQLRDHFRTQNFVSTERWYADQHFDWSSLSVAASMPSLFEDRRLLELHCLSNKLGEKAHQALIQYTENPPKEVVLLITSPKLETSTQKTKWFTTVEKNSVFIAVWPIERTALPMWIRTRAKANHLRLQETVVELIVEQTEGHLLASAQALEKLALSYPDQEITLEMAESILSDDTRFDVFTLVDDCITGNIEKALHALDGLKKEGVDSTLIVWALTREIRLLAEMSAKLLQSNTLSTLFKQYHVWPKKQAGILSALQRHPLKKWYRFLQHAARLDRLQKGAQTGNVWHELQDLCLTLGST